TREVERELQTARQRAVSKGRAMRVRFNCPSAGQYRAVELIGPTSAPTAADAAADRCSPSLYRYPANDTDPLTKPNFDGPVRELESTVTFSNSQTIEFWADGTAHYDNGATGRWPMIPPAGVSLTLTRKGKTSTLEVNGLGRIKIY
ncbi:MAG TPA: GspH/FimT family pseudopilin, partial [Vicinamibacterales bacterium]|nr:GspH/FimT family pseudopilin [Vicinamibacterales bacterium]